MSSLTLALALLVGCGLLALVLNHGYARLALVELALNEGLPPGHERDLDPLTPASVAIDGLLEPGVHVFLSRGCHACQRLIEAIAATDVNVESRLLLHYVDRARPVAHQAASARGAELVEQQQELAATVRADPLPYTIAIGEHGLVSRAVTPTVDQMLAAARDAGISADRSVTT